jgi:GNAT superfamily N-acetyltransferase
MGIFLNSFIQATKPGTTMNAKTSDAVDGDGYSMRMATIADLPTIMHHRRQMFVDMGFTDRAELDAMEATSVPHIAAGLKNGSYLGWLMEMGGGVIAGGGVLLYERPSSPRDPTNRRACILNVYTEPSFRKRGYARVIVEDMIRWCKEQKYNWVSLHASADGRHLYESLGFTPTNEMQLDLRVKE